MERYPLRSEFERFKCLTAAEKKHFWEQQKEKLSNMAPEEQKKLIQAGYEYILQQARLLNQSIPSSQEDNAA